MSKLDRLRQDAYANYESSPEVLAAIEQVAGQKFPTRGSNEATRIWENPVDGEYWMVVNLAWKYAADDTLLLRWQYREFDRVFFAPPETPIIIGNYAALVEAMQEVIGYGPKWVSPPDAKFQCANWEHNYLAIGDRSGKIFRVVLTNFWTGDLKFVLANWAADNHIPIAWMTAPPLKETDISKLLSAHIEGHIEVFDELVAAIVEWTDYEINREIDITEEPDDENSAATLGEGIWVCGREVTMDYTVADERLEELLDVASRLSNHPAVKVIWGDNREQRPLRARAPRDYLHFYGPIISQNDRIIVRQREGVRGYVYITLNQIIDGVEVQPRVGYTTGLNRMIFDPNLTVSL